MFYFVDNTMKISIGKSYKFHWFKVRKRGEQKYANAGFSLVLLGFYIVFHKNSYGR